MRTQEPFAPCSFKGKLPPVVVGTIEECVAHEAMLVGCSHKRKGNRRGEASFALSAIGEAR
jgi:hypothetical protein